MSGNKGDKSGPKSSTEVEFQNETLGVPYTKEEVEDEVLEAVKEVKEPEDDPESCVTAISPELYAMMAEPEVTEPEVTEPEVTEPEVKPVEETRAEKIWRQKPLVNALRRADDVHNRTCSKCMRRRPIDTFRRLKLSEVCEDCEQNT